MQEKRRYKRLPIQLHLEVSEIFKQNNEIVKDLDADITVFDISKAGIGFTTSTVIPDGYYFNATLQLDNTEQKLFTVVKTLHHTQIDDNTYRYGCEFVGLAGIFNFVFDEYAQSLGEEHA
ncbi:MAG: PilZ domain-containing protein [Eubacteriales bacterium]|nr:PilZ domain-containing protein [Eubacteriales bacterium]